MWLIIQQARIQKNFLGGFRKVLGCELKKNRWNKSRKILRLNRPKYNLIFHWIRLEYNCSIVIFYTVLGISVFDWTLLSRGREGKNPTTPVYKPAVEHVIFYIYIQMYSRIRWVLTECWSSGKRAYQGDIKIRNYNVSKVTISIAELCYGEKSLWRTVIFVCKTAQTLLSIFYNI